MAWYLVLGIVGFSGGALLGYGAALYSVLSRWRDMGVAGCRCAHTGQLLGRDD